MAAPTASSTIDSPVNVSNLGLTNSTDKATLYDIRMRGGPVYTVRWIDSQKRPCYVDIIKAVDIEVL